MSNYKGEINSEGKKHGKGIDYDSNGQKIYEGDFVNGINPI